MTEKKTPGITNKMRNTSYKPMPEVKNSIGTNNNSILKNVDKINQIELLSKTNKSIVIPANVWCDFNAVLHASDNDYTYELLEEMLATYKENNNLSTNEKYLKRLDRLEEDELEKIESKNKKNKK